MVRPRKTSPTDLVLTLDFGGSGLKGIYVTQYSTSQGLYLEPECSVATKESLVEKTASYLGKAYPENLAWVGVEQEYVAVGYLAASRYHASPGLSHKKYELAVYKALAAVWVVKERLSLPNKFNVSLTLLLPPGEFEDSSLLEPLLVAGLSKFETPTGTLRVKLTNYECFPEGGGVYMMYSKSVGELIKQQVIAVVMVGYRNASVLVSRRGVVDKGRTSNLGMVRLAELVSFQVSGLSPNQLAPAIAAADSDPRPNHFLKLATASSRSSRLAEVERIIKAIATSRAEYATALMGWLREVLPNQEELDEVVIAGGTADYLHKELNDYFFGTPVVWHGDVEIPERFEALGLGNRLADVYALSVYHAHKQRKVMPWGSSEAPAEFKGVPNG